MSAHGTLADREGVAFWAPRLPGWEIARAVIRGEQPPPGAAGAAAGADVAWRRPSGAARPIPSRSRSKLPAAPARAPAREPQQLPSVFASTHGDLAISDYMCATLAQHADADLADQVSQLRAQRGGGLLEHRHGRATRRTPRSARTNTRSATGCSRRRCRSACERSAVLYVAFDIEAKGPLATMAPSRVCSARRWCSRRPRRQASCAGSVPLADRVEEAHRHRRLGLQPRSWRTMPWRLACRSSKRWRDRTRARSVSRLSPATALDVRLSIFQMLSTPMKR